MRGLRTLHRSLRIGPLAELDATTIAAVTQKEQLLWRCLSTFDCLSHEEPRRSRLCDGEVNAEEMFLSLSLLRMHFQRDVLSQSFEKVCYSARSLYVCDCFAKFDAFFFVLS